MHVLEPILKYAVAAGIEAAWATRVLDLGFMGIENTQLLETSGVSGGFAARAVVWGANRPPPAI